jgi:hypothetical protein
LRASCSHPYVSCSRSIRPGLLRTAIQPMDRWRGTTGL